eukprot:RCo027403
MEQGGLLEALLADLAVEGEFTRRFVVTLENSERRDLEMEFLHGARRIQHASTAAPQSPSPGKRKIPHWRSSQAHLVFAAAFYPLAILYLAMLGWPLLVSYLNGQHRAGDFSS